MDCASFLDQAAEGEGIFHLIFPRIFFLGVSGVEGIVFLMLNSRCPILGPEGGFAIFLK